MQNLGINAVEHKLKNKRFIVLEPYYMEGVGKGGLGVEVYVNGEKQTRGSVDDPSKQLFKLDMKSTDEVVLHVKIVVKEGSIRIGEKDAYGIYPAMYDKVEGYLKIKQFNFVDWMQNPNIDVDTKMLVKGDVFEYDHLVPKSASFLRVYVNEEKHRNEFIENKTLCDSSLENIMINGMYDYYCDTAYVSPEERTKRLIDGSK